MASERSANSPQEVTPRPTPPNDAQQPRRYVCAGQSHFSTATGGIKKQPKDGVFVPLQRLKQADCAFIVQAAECAA